ncbi:MAG: hypothetical protein P0S96_02085 [Simkaniaceae bacterium]|nr:hypothetical protein [Candidatus Sacchlamyda saccharinae]
MNFDEILDPPEEIDLQMADLTAERSPDCFKETLINSIPQIFGQKRWKT